MDFRLGGAARFLAAPLDETRDELVDLRLTLKEEDGVDPAPMTLGGSPVLLMLSVDDVDALGERMVAAGGKIVFEIGDHEDGRGGRILDPFGHAWMISQHSA